MASRTLEVTPGALPQDGDLITNATLRALARPTVTQITGVGSADIDDGSVTTAKLADGVLSADATGRGKMADAFLTTPKYGDATLTAAKLDQAARGDVHQTAPGVYDAGTAVYAVTLTPIRAGAYVAGEIVRFKADTVNAAAADVNVNARGAANLFKGVAAELLAGDIPAGIVVTAIYDGTNFQVQQTPPQEFTSTAYTIPASGSVANAPHGLGATPRWVRWVLVCTSVELEYAVGDEVNAADADSGSGQPSFSSGANATNIFLTFNAAGGFVLMSKTSGTVLPGTRAKWTAKCYARQ